jgi:putative DNA methylase
VNQEEQVRRYDRKNAVVFLKTKEAFGGLSNMAGGFPLLVNARRVSLRGKEQGAVEGGRGAAEKGTKTGRGSNFSCVLTGTAIDGDHVKAEGKAAKMGARLMAIVAEGTRGRKYLPPTKEHEALAATARPAWEPEGELPNDPRNFWTVQYGLSTFTSLFAPRQIVALTTFSDLVGEAREKTLVDAYAAGLTDDSKPLHAEGSGATAYADAVATYLAFAVDKASDRNTTLCAWETKMDRMRNTFGRQAIPMVWDYAETNPLSGAGGDIAGTAFAVFEVLAKLDNAGIGGISNVDAVKNSFPVRPIVVSTDPPYYDNIGYADLSDFFYIWLKRSLAGVWSDLFRRLMTPKAEELVATPYRHGGKDEAEAFFMKGMGEALTAMCKAATDGESTTPTSNLKSLKKAFSQLAGHPSCSLSLMLGSLSMAPGLFEPSFRTG